MIAGENAQNLRIKFWRVVHLLAVAELVYDDAVQYVGRREHEQAVEAEIALGATAAPTPTPDCGW